MHSTTMPNLCLIDDVMNPNIHSANVTTTKPQKYNSISEVLTSKTSKTYKNKYNTQDRTKLSLADEPLLCGLKKCNDDNMESQRGRHDGHSLGR